MFMEDTQLMKGILEGCVLSIISENETYGYEILTRLVLEGFNELGEGTLYPVLTRLEKKGLISCRKQKSPLGPVRKYYTLSKEGYEWLEEFKKVYKSTVNSANKILFKNNSE